MRQDKDRAAKWIITHHGDAILRLGGVTGFTHWQPLQAEVIAPRRLPDGLLEVRYPDDPLPAWVLVEIETYPDNTADAQVLDDLMLIAVDRQVVPDVVSLVLKPKVNVAVTGRAERRSRRGGAVLSGAWSVVQLWDLNAEDLFAAGDVGLIPWVPLTQTRQPPDQLLARCRDRLAAVPDPHDRAGLMAVSQILAGLAYPDRRFLDLFGGAEAMIESPVLDEVVALVEKRTTERVTQQVTQQVTRDVALRAHVESVLDILADRFGAVPEDVQAKLAAITDRARLRALVRLAATCPDLAAFAAQV